MLCLRHAGYRPDLIGHLPDLILGHPFLNFATSAPGYIKLELQDEVGAPIPGFSLADSPELIGNDIDRSVAFKNDLKTLAGKSVRLRLVMKDADLFSLRFGDSLAPNATPASVSTRTPQ